MRCHLFAIGAAGATSVSFVPMKLFRVHQLAICVVATCVLVAQLLVAGHMPMPRASVLDAVLGETPICTSHGPIDAKPAGPRPVPSENKQQCPCCMLGCLSGCAGNAVADAVEFHSIAIVVRGTGVAVVPAAGEAPVTYLRLTTSHPRAPPPSSASGECLAGLLPPLRVVPSSGVELRWGYHVPSCARRGCVKCRNHIFADDVVRVCSPPGRAWQHSGRWPGQHDFRLNP